MEFIYLIHLKSQTDFGNTYDPSVLKVSLRHLINEVDYEIDPLILYNEFLIIVLMDSDYANINASI